MSVFRFGRSFFRSFCKQFTDKGKTFRLLFFWHNLSLAFNLLLVSICEVVYVICWFQRIRKGCSKVKPRKWRRNQRGPQDFCQTVSCCFPSFAECQSVWKTFMAGFHVHFYFFYLLQFNGIKKSD